MEIIKVNGLSKHFKILNRREGILGAFKDLFSKDFRIVKAVNSVSMSIDKGEIVGFIGPNGAGKSTTIKMLTGVLKPSEGEIIINNYKPFEQRRKYVRNIGVVLGQRSQLWWDIPVIESLKLLKDVFRIPDTIYRENMELFRELLNLDKFYSVPVRKLSLGQRMICDIAASFLHNPEIIFLDEPTIGLDISVKSKVRDIIKNLNQLKQTTILITSHDVGDIESLCRRIILIDKGKKLYDGGIEQFNSLFGSYRTLNAEIPDLSEAVAGTIEKMLNEKFPCKGKILVKKNVNGWLDVIFNQQEIQLLNILNVLLKKADVKDIKIQDTELAHVIKMIYEGAEI